MCQVNVSMPSVSGWVLQNAVNPTCVADETVSMPSVSGWVLQGHRRAGSLPRVQDRFYALGVGLGFAVKYKAAYSRSRWRFYALGVGLGFAEAEYRVRAVYSGQVSMPSVSGWVLQPRYSSIIWKMKAVFLCPRCLAGFCSG